MLARLGESRSEAFVDLGGDTAHDLLAALAIVAPSAVPRRPPESPNVDLGAIWGVE
ncbi:hypothetical protein [Streptomyces lavendulae]|uniref:hypothetical protein n=1 Tax=Streptomyces lavendulae TaxID=1914 RepID=UPI0036E9B98A